MTGSFTARRSAWFLLIALVVAACGGSEPRPAAAPRRTVSARAQPPPPKPVIPLIPPDLRLPDLAVPTAYRLRLELDPDAESFAGHVDIDVRLAAATDHVWLNAQELAITGPAYSEGGAPQPLTALELRNPDVVGFGFGRAIGPGAVTLHFDFTGKVSSSGEMSALFRQKERDRWYLYSQLESISARRVFPSFDEPRFKVPWQVTLVVPARQVALSNSPVQHEQVLADGRREIAFAATPPLPSYLVAVAVGPFELVDAGKVGRSGIPARIAVPAGRAREARAAVEVTPRLVAALEDYFDMPLPFAKLDQVVVPQFFGAMENPGLITYDSDILLEARGRDGEDFRRTLVSIAGHELAHQWFGNMVTLAWWDDLWLNESFATWMADKVAARLAPQWDGAARQVADADRAMSSDAEPPLRPLRRPITERDQIEAGFDAISYEKGGAVLSMFERWIGEDRFRAGVRAYIARHAGGNASAGDFLEALAKVSSPELRRSFAAFLDQPGVPLVRLSMSCEGHPRLRVRQERLAEVPLPGAAESTGGAPWPLPVCVRHGGAGKPVEQCQLVDSADTEISLDAAACPAWLVGNAGAAGYYRVAYDDDLTQRILRALPRLALTERLAIASDAGALVALGHADLASAFEIAGGLLATGEGRSVAAAIELIADTRSLVDTPALPRWRRHVTRILGARAHALDLARPPKAAVDRQIWTRLVRTMALLVEDPALLAQARTLIERWLAGKGGVADDDLDLVLSVAARGGDAALFERLLAAAQASKDEHVRDELFASLGQFRDRALVDRTLRLLLDPKIDIGRVRGASQALFSRRDTQAQAWAFFKDNVDAVVPRLPKHVQERLPRVTSAFCEADLRRDVEAFFAPRVKGAAAGQRALTEALADIDRCMARRARNGAAVEALLGK